MILPVMILLASAEGESFDISFLSDSDCGLIEQEIDRLGSVLNSDILATDTDGSFLTCQEVGAELVEMNPYTILILERLRTGYQNWSKYKNRTMFSEESVQDLSCEEVISSIEYSASFAQIYVYRLMKSNLSFRNKIEEINRVLNIIKKNSNKSSTYADIQGKDKTKLYHMSKVSHWQEILYGDYSSRFKGCPPFITEDTLTKVSDELRQLGIYGFENPINLYTSFASSRLLRKVTATVDSSVITYLQNCVIGGGIYENNH